MKRRAPELDPSGLPPELAAGPVPSLWALPDALRPRWITEAGWRRSTARAAWLKACTVWSRENGHGPNGWRDLLPDEVREMTSAKGRLRFPRWPKEEHGIT